MSITPLTVSVSGSDTVLTTFTPQYVTLECSASGNRGTVFSMFINRNNEPLASIAKSDSTSNPDPQLVSNPPSDVPSKNPTLEGNVNSGSSSFLRVKYLQDRVDCRDGVTYQCIVTSHNIDQGLIDTQNHSASLTVHSKQIVLTVFPIVLTCPMLYGQYTRSLLFDKLSVVFVLCTDNTHQVGVFIVKVWQTIDTDCSSAVFNLVVVRSSLLTSYFFLENTYLMCVLVSSEMSK